MILGGDYSLWDEVLDWANHEWEYAFIKASEGIVEDPVFKEQWKAAQGYVYRGAYHFFRPLVPWRAAAEKFMTLMDMNGSGELPAVLDLEVINGVSNEKIRDHGLEWLRFVHREMGVRPIVYTSPGFSDTIQLYRSVEYSDYPLWQATYPWDEITSTWKEFQRIQRIKEVLAGEYPFRFPVAARPWRDVGRRATWVQWTGKCPPEFVSGYPLRHKDAVDVNYYEHGLQEMIFQFNLPELVQGDDDMSSKPVTWTAELQPGETSNLRVGPGLTYAIRRQITAPPDDVILYTGTGQKQQNPVDKYYWGEVLTPEPGWIAFTTSFGDSVKWVPEPEEPTDPTDPVPTPEPRYVVKSVLHYNTGETQELP